MALLINPYRFASAGYDPASVFEGGTYKGFWIDANDISTLKTDQAGTTAVTAANDPVGRILGKSGNGEYFGPFGSDSRRATYQVEGGYGCLRFDGTDDKYSGDSTLTTALNDANAYTVVFVVKFAEASPAEDDTLLFGDDYDYLLLARRSANSAEIRHRTFGGGIYDSNPDVIGNSSKHVITVTANGNGVANPGVVMRIDGAANYTLNSAFSDSGFITDLTSTPICIGGWKGTNSTGTLYGDLYQAFMVIGKALTGTDLTDLEKGVAARAGVTL